MRDGKRAALGLALLLGVALASRSVSLNTPAALERGTPPRSALAAAVPRTLGVAQVSREARVGPAASDRTPPTRASAVRPLGFVARASTPQWTEPPHPARPESEPARGPDHRILLEPVAAAHGAVTASFAGYDTGAPRTLELWRVDAGRPQRLGRVTSDAGARIAGPQLALPDGGIALVVTPRGVQPGEPGASQPLRLARAPNRLPAAASYADDDLPRWRRAAADRSPQGGL